MGIKPFRSLTLDPIFSTNNGLSTSIQQRYHTIHSSDLQNYQIYNPSQIVYKSSTPFTQQYVQKERYQYNSSDEMDNLNQYIFFLKSSSSNMDTTNLHIPYQINMKTRGLCQQTQQVEIFYPFFQYRLRAEMQARQVRHQNFHESEIWYLLMSVLNGMRQFQRIKCVSTEFTMEMGRVKIDSMMASPARMQTTRNERMYWSHKNMVNYYVQETYRLGLVLLELCTSLPLSSIIEEEKRKERAVKTGNMLYNLQVSPPGTPERDIKRTLQIVQQRYSQLLFNLLNVMLCHPRDRPLPSQIYQVLSPYKNDILLFKPFNFNPQTMAIIQASLINSTLRNSTNNSNLQRMNNSLGLGQIQTSFLGQNSVMNSENSDKTNRYKLDSKIYDQNEEDNESEMNNLGQMKNKQTGYGNRYASMQNRGSRANLSDGFHQNTEREIKVRGIEDYRNNDIYVHDYRNQRRNFTLDSQPAHDYSRSKTIANNNRRPNNPANTPILPTNIPHPRNHQQINHQNRPNYSNIQTRQQQSLSNMKNNINMTMNNSLNIPNQVNIPNNKNGDAYIREAQKQPLVYYDRDYNRQEQMRRLKRNSELMSRQKYPTTYLSN